MTWAEAGHYGSDPQRTRSITGTIQEPPSGSGVSTSLGTTRVN